MRASRSLNAPCSRAGGSLGSQATALIALGSRLRGSTGGRWKQRIAPLALIPLLSACASQVASGVEPAAPGFLLGLWHGFIFPVAWILSLFVSDIAIYAVPNNGGWYDFGYFIGVVFLGVGARSSRTVYRTRVVERPARRGTVIENER